VSQLMRFRNNLAIAELKGSARLERFYHEVSRRTFVHNERPDGE